MTRTTLVTITVTGPVDDMNRPWIWEVQVPGAEMVCGTADSDEGAWSEARDVATALTTVRLETAGHQLRDAIGGDQ